MHVSKTHPSQSNKNNRNLFINMALATTKHGERKGALIYGRTCKLVIAELFISVQMRKSTQ